MSQISALSTQYVKAPITAPDNPTVDVVTMAFVPVGTNPGESDWKAASWDTVTLTGGVTQYLAKALVGPAGVITLAAGHYQVWISVIDDPETPVLMSDVLIVV